MTEDLTCHPFHPGRSINTALPVYFSRTSARVSQEEQAASGYKKRQPTRAVGIESIFSKTRNTQHLSSGTMFFWKLYTIIHVAHEILR